MAEPDAGTGLPGGRRVRGRPVDRDALFANLAPAGVERPKTLSNSIGMPFVLVPDGTFEMGSPLEEEGHRANEGPRHEVVIGRPLYICPVVTTQRVYQMVTGQN